MGEEHFVLEPPSQSPSHLWGSLSNFSKGHRDLESPQAEDAALLVAYTQLW